MSTDQPNPYAAPVTGDATGPAIGAPSNIDPPSLKKIEAIIKDAGQFWLAIIMCIVCSALGSIIIGPWYLVRFLQWRTIAREQPMLLDPNVPRGSVAQRFQSAKIKLIIGMSFGALIFMLVGLLFIVSFAGALAANSPPA